MTSRTGGYHNVRGSLVHKPVQRIFLLRMLSLQNNIKLKMIFDGYLISSNK
jgi:hypothetical protein